MSLRHLTTTVAALALLTATAAQADEGREYSVTITNLTKGQTFTPILAATHTSDIAYFELGQPAIAPLAEVAESGSTASLQGVLDSVPEYVFDTDNSGGLLGPGDSVTLSLNARGRYRLLSFAGMLIPTNDNFVALNSVRLPARSATYYALAYDAGSEENDELCASIPGPPCFGEGNSVADGEGFIFIGNGIHGLGDLPPETYDWRNPVAKVVVTRQ